MLDKMMNNPAIAILAFAFALVGVAEGVATVISFFKNRREKDIDKLLNRNKDAMDELRKLVEDLEKKDQT